MKLILLLCLFPFVVSAQNVGIGTNTPQARLEIKNPVKSTALISSANYNDTAQLILKNRNASEEGTDFILSANREQALVFKTASDITNNNHDSILTITPSGRAGINNSTPSERLDVRGNINVTGSLKVNSNAGTNGQFLQSNGDGTMQWGNLCEFKNYSIYHYTTAGAVQTFIVPAGVTKIKIELWGGGGSGAYIFIGGDEYSGAGGSGGGYAVANFDVTPSATISIVIGNGGFSYENGFNSTASAGSPARTLTAFGGEFSGYATAGGARFQVGSGGGFSGTGFTSYTGQKGQDGFITTTSYEQRTATEFVKKMFYGNGGNAGNTSNTGGRGSFTMTGTGFNTITNSGTPAAIPGGGGPSRTYSPDVQSGAPGMAIVYY